MFCVWLFVKVFPEGVKTHPNSNASLFITLILTTANNLTCCWLNGAEGCECVAVTTQGTLENGGNFLSGKTD